MEYGCDDCELPSFQDELVIWSVVLSPFLLTVLVSLFFVRRATEPLSVPRLMAISVPGALPAVFAMLLMTNDSVFARLTLVALVVALWSVTFGPTLVFFTQWVYLELRRLRRK